MPSEPALKLKWTSVDEDARQWRKAQRRARKAQEAAGPSKYRSSLSSGRFRHHRSRSASPDNASRDNDPDRHPLEDEFNAHHLSPQSLDQLRAEIEEARFRSKLFDAMEDDQRLDMLEASFNAHIPPRWSSPGAGPSTTDTTSSNANTIDPSVMTEEQYAEWIREGMWRRTHRTEVESQERRAKEREARKEKERLARQMVEKEEREREARRKLARAEKEKKRRAEAWNSYRRLWDVLTATAAAAVSASAPASVETVSVSQTEDDADDMVPARPPLTFTELPWPTYPPPINIDELTKDGVSSFLLATDHSADKTRKQRIREALLAYHPDRYVGRYMAAIDPSHRALVQEAVVKVTIALNALAEDDASK